MAGEQIAEKLCKYSFMELGDSKSYYSYENYWNKNRRYFVEQAETYLRVKKCLEKDDSIYRADEGDQ